MMKVVVVLWIMLKKVWCKSGAQIIYGKMATKSAIQIPLVYWIYLFWGRQNCQIDSGDDAI
jgi:hypothetical protein